MPAITGVKIVSGSISWVTVQGVRSAPEYVNHKSCALPSGDGIPALANWAETLFINMLDAEKPDLVACKLTIPLNKVDQVERIYYSFGVLNLVAYKKGIDVVHVLPTSVRPSVFGLPKESDAAKHMVTLLGHHPPGWSGVILDAALAAVAKLPK